MYRERASRVAGAVVWTRVVPAAESTHRVLPDGCVDLIWCDGSLLVAGPDTRARLVTSRPGAAYVAVRFPPGVGPAVLGMPADLLRDELVPLAELWPTGAGRRAAEQVLAAARRGTAIEELALARLAERRPDPVARLVADRLAAGARVTAAAAEVGLSDRQLRRRCVTAFGYGPKTLARILRLQRALSQARSGGAGDAGSAGDARGAGGVAAVAAATGYADQAHLAREARALTGVPLGELIR